MITSLKPNQVFVFGSNIEGNHIGGAAAQAHKDFGAEMGVGKGMTGQCYALDTMSGQDEFQNNLEDFVRYAKRHTNSTFLLTKVGCGIAGYDERHVQEMLDIACYRTGKCESSTLPKNIIKVGWEKEEKLCDLSQTF